uniref:Uncharacterized protein n=1 Tax=Denticeps clupeoides TaxID=299321 RepID=A0AAY4DRW3_9TELE
VTAEPGGLKLSAALTPPRCGRQQPAALLRVFTGKNGSVQTIPSLAKVLKGIAEPILGLQYVYEYRSPTKSAPPYYVCRLCKVQQLQLEMVSHIKGWKHSFRYLRRNHPNKVSHGESDINKDQSLRKALKETVLKVVKSEGRGNHKVRRQQVFHSGTSTGTKYSRSASLLGTALLWTCAVIILCPALPLLGLFGYSDFPADFGVRDSDLRVRNFPEDRPLPLDDDDFGAGPRNSKPDRSYPDDFCSNRMGEGSMGGVNNESVPATLLKYLDSFRIETESDAQIVLKVTQKLTDILMEYRLRTVSSVTAPHTLF